MSESLVFNIYRIQATIKSLENSLPRLRQWKAHHTAEYLQVLYSELAQLENQLGRYN
jgi:hypothetical protein